MPLWFGQEVQEVLRQSFVSAPGEYPAWAADGLRFTCLRCGGCCSGEPGYVWVSEEECRQIADYLGMTFDAFTRRHVRRAGQRLSLLEKRNGDCEFLERDESGKSGCVVHMVRPSQCRTWPFWRSNLKSARSWEQAAQHCPGINQGQLWSPESVAAALRETSGLPL